MSKLFWVDKKPTQSAVESHEMIIEERSHGGRHSSSSHHDPLGHTDHGTYENPPQDISIESRDHEEHEVDVGQIALDVLDLAEEIVIVAPIAGVDPSDIDIALSRNIITLSGERKQPSLYLDAKRMLAEECYYGPFSRSIILPENLAFNKIKATTDNNMIFVHIPKITFFSKSIKIEK